MMGDPLLQHIETLDPALFGVRSPISILRTTSWPAGLRHRTTLVEHAEGAFILRLPARAQADLANEHRALRALVQRRVGPRPLHLGRYRDKDYLLLEYLPGQTVHRFGERRLRALAALLARLHDTKPGGVRDAHVLRSLEDLVMRISDEAPRDALMAAVCLVGDQGLPDGPRRLLHGDIQRENLVAHRGVLRLIDFEEAGCGDPAFELAEVVDHLSLRPPQVCVLLDEYDRCGGDRGLHKRVAAYRPLKQLLNVAWTVAWRTEAAPGEWPELVRDALPSLRFCQRAGLVPREFRFPTAPGGSDRSAFRLH